MMETLWTVCAWTGFVWWSGVIIAATVYTSARLLDAALAQWEEDEIRRIASDELPPNWRELDTYRSTEEAWAEMRRRKDNNA